MLPGTLASRVTGDAPASRSVGDMLPEFLLAPIRRIPQDAPLTLVGASGETLAATAICLSGKRRYINRFARHVSYLLGGVEKLIYNPRTA